VPIKLFDISDTYRRQQGGAPGKARRRGQFLPGSDVFIRAQIALASLTLCSIAADRRVVHSTRDESLPTRPSAAFGFVASAD
jgi:hypothetical protein